MAEAIDTTTVGTEHELKIDSAYDLKALDLFIDRKDVRYFLTGLHLDNKYMTATNGIVLLRIRHDQDLGLGEDGIVVSLPKVTVKASDLQCSISIEETETPVPHGNDTVTEYSRVARLFINDTVHKLEIIDGQYPDVTKVIPSENQTKQSDSSFQSQYLELIAKAARLLNNNKKETTCRLYGETNGAHRVEISGRDDIDMVIMPTANRDKS